MAESMQESLHDDKEVGDTYQIINPDKLGHAVIINNVATEFPGSKKDTEAMVKTYQMIKFEVSLSEDCNDKQMRSIRKWLTQEETHQNMSMVAVNIITHGTDDGWLKPVDNQGIGWFLLEIVGAICDVQALMNKPKLFFVNACRGNSKASGFKPNAKSDLAADPFSIKFDQLTADMADVFIGYSTTAGKISPIDSDEGTDFFQILSSLLQAQYQMNPLDHIFKMVTKEVSRNVHSVASNTFKHICESRSTLKATVFFTADPQTREKYLEKTVGNLAKENNELRGQIAKHREYNEKMAKQIEELEEKLEQKEKPVENRNVETETDHKGINDVVVQSRVKMHCKLRFAAVYFIAAITVYILALMSFKMVVLQSKTELQVNRWQDIANHMAIINGFEKKVEKIESLIALAKIKFNAFNEILKEKQVSIYQCRFQLEIIQRRSEVIKNGMNRNINMTEFVSLLELKNLTNDVFQKVADYKLGEKANTDKDQFYELIGQIEYNTNIFNSSVNQYLNQLMFTMFNRCNTTYALCNYDAMLYRYRANMILQAIKQLDMLRSNIVRKMENASESTILYYKGTSKLLIKVKKEFEEIENLLEPVFENMNLRYFSDDTVGVSLTLPMT